MAVVCCCITDRRSGYARVGNSARSQERESFRLRHLDLTFRGSGVLDVKDPEELLNANQ